MAHLHTGQKEGGGCYHSAACGSRLCPKIPCTDAAIPGLASHEKGACLASLSMRSAQHMANSGLGSLLGSSQVLLMSSYDVEARD